MDSAEFFGADEADQRGLESDKDQYGRYLLDADGAGKRPYTRATTLAKTLDDGRGLAIWNQRKLMKGVAQSAALVERAKVAPLDDRRVWREITDAADVLSAGNEKRDLGSAFHELHARVPDLTDDEWAAVSPELRATYVKYRAELDRLGITEVMTEVTVVNTKIGTAGTLDGIVRLADGRLVVLDRKSGRITEYPHAACVQLATYANADVMLTFNEDGSVERHPMPEIDTTMALVVDITIGNENTAAAHVYEANLMAGWYGALLSAKVRRWRNSKDLILPYHPDPFAERVATGAAEVVPATGHTALPPNQAWFEQGTPGQPQPIERVNHSRANATPHISPTAAAVLGTGPAIGADDTMAFRTPHPNTHPAWSSKEQAVIQLDSKGERVPDPADLMDNGDGTRLDDEATLLANGAGVPWRPGDDEDLLLKTFKTKAELQGVLAKVSPGANLARQRKNLAADIVAHPSWPARRAEFLPNTAAQLADKVAHEFDPEAAQYLSPVVSNAPGPVPPDPEPTYTTQAMPPTEQPAANPFIGPPVTEVAPAVAPEEPLEDVLLRQIGEADSQARLADIWQAANDAGIGWPPRLHQAATIRQKQLAAPAAQ